MSQTITSDSPYIIAWGLTVSGLCFVSVGLSIVKGLKGWEKGEKKDGIIAKPKIDKDGAVERCCSLRFQRVSVERPQPQLGRSS